MDFLGNMDISASGLAAQRTRMEVASGNIANALTTRTPEGGPYRRRDVVLESVPAGEADGLGVRVAAVLADPSSPRLEYQPGHADANADGFVAYPNVQVIEEMVDMITASRAYEAGLSALDTVTAMAERAMGIGR